MNKRSLTKRTVALVSALVLIGAAAFATFAAKSQQDYEMKPKEFATRFNEGVAKLDAVTYSNLHIQSYSTSSKINVQMNHAPKEHFLYTKNMTAQIDAQTCYKNNITCMTLTGSPYEKIDPTSDAYLKEFNDTAALMLTSLFRDMNDTQARTILNKNLQLPATSGDEPDWALLAEGTKATVKMDGIRAEFRGSMTETGDVKVTAKLLFETTDVVLLSTAPNPNAYIEEAIPVDLEGTTTVKVGESFQIDLQANSGREHKWTYSVSGDGASRLVKDWIHSDTNELGCEPAVPSTIKAPTAADKICEYVPTGDITGGAQHDQFTFLATRTGRQEFTFEYWYPSNGKRIVTQIVQFTVEIER